MSGRFAVIFDTEYTTWSDAKPSNWGLPNQHRELVQIAGRKWIEGTDWEESRQYNSFCRPVFNPNLSDSFKELTGIKQSDIDSAATAEHVLYYFNQKLEISSPFCNAAWSNGNDINPIAETAGLQRFVLPFNPIKFQNLRIALHSCLTKEVGEYDRSKYPSGKVYELLELSLPTNQVHNAMHDVDSLCITISELMRRGHNFDFLWKT